MAMVRLLDRAAGKLPEQLFDPLAWEQIRRIAGTFPPLSGAILEYHFGRGARRTDFSIRATSSDGGREVLAGTHPLWSIADPVVDGKYWQTIQAFAHCWSDPEQLLFRAIENVWLEFDIRPSRGSHAQPALFFDLDRHARLSPGEKAGVLQVALKACNYRLDPEFFGYLRERLELLPTHLQLYYIGLLWSRPHRPLRISLVGSEKAALASYLRENMPKEEARVWRSVLSTYAPETQKLMLNLDVYPEPDSKVSVEVFMKNEREWAPYFDFLVKRGLFSAREAEAILSWSGDVPMTKDDFQEMLSEVYGRNIRLLIRRINHVKLFRTSLGGTGAKVYLYVGYC